MYWVPVSETIVICEPSLFTTSLELVITTSVNTPGFSNNETTTSIISPYGYIKDPKDKLHWIIDEEAAEVVRDIFRLCMAGFGPTQIAKQLEIKIPRRSRGYFICAFKGLLLAAP